MFVQRFLGEAGSYLPQAAANSNLSAKVDSLSSLWIERLDELNLVRVRLPGPTGVQHGTHLIGSAIWANSTQKGRTFS